MKPRCPGWCSSWQTAVSWWQPWRHKLTCYNRRRLMKRVSALSTSRGNLAENTCYNCRCCLCLESTYSFDSASAYWADCISWEDIPVYHLVSGHQFYGLSQVSTGGKEAVVPPSLKQYSVVISLLTMVSFFLPAICPWSS